MAAGKRSDEHSHIHTRSLIYHGHGVAVLYPRRNWYAPDNVLLPAAAAAAAAVSCGPTADGKTHPEPLCLPIGLRIHICVRACLRPVSLIRGKLIVCWCAQYPPCIRPSAASWEAAVVATRQLHELYSIACFHSASPSFLSSLHPPTRHVIL